MAYLLTVVNIEVPTSGAAPILCYYINESKNIQVIRAINGAKCNFERILFSEERILFTTFPESHLQIYSFLVHRIRSSTIDCKLLNIDEKPRQDISTHKPQKYPAI